MYGKQICFKEKTRTSEHIVHLSDKYFDIGFKNINILYVLNYLVKNSNP